MVMVFGIETNLPFLKSKGIIFISLLEKIIIERTVQYVKDKVESFDDSFLVYKRTTVD